MKKFFLSFADTRYSTGAFERLKVQASNFGFDEIILLTEKDLSQSYIDYIRPYYYRRGFGYWRWKSMIVKQTMGCMSDGDILFYSDAGTYWNEKGLSRFHEYLFELGKEKNGGILTFQEPFLEKDYSKGDALKLLGVYNNWDVLMSFQLWAGCFGIRKCENSVQLISQWYNLLHQPSFFHLITDKRSSVSNLPGFVEHRHDQSIFSLLVKLVPHVEIDWKEQRMMTSEDSEVSNWSKMEKFPIQGRRYINRDLKVRISSLPVNIYRLLLCFYLRLFEDFT